MKGKITAMLTGAVGTMLVATSFILPVSAKIYPVQNSTMRNTPSQTNFAQRQAVNNSIAHLRYTDLAGGARSNVLNSPDGSAVRIDRQGQTANGQNIQVQLNGQRPRGEGSTVAGVLVPRDYLNDSGHGHQAAHQNQARHREVERNVRNALLESFRSYLAHRPAIFTLRGELSNSPKQFGKRGLNQAAGTRTVIVLQNGVYVANLCIKNQTKSTPERNVEACTGKKVKGSRKDLTIPYDRGDRVDFIAAVVGAHNRYYRLADRDTHCWSEGRVLFGKYRVFCRTEKEADPFK